MAKYPITTYQASPEMLAYYRSLPKPDATPKQIEHFKRSQAINKQQNKEREERLALSQKGM